VAKNEIYMEEEKLIITKKRRSHLSQCLKTQLLHLYGYAEERAQNITENKIQPNNDSNDTYCRL
jgi:hypothetical protein